MDLESPVSIEERLDQFVAATFKLSRSQAAKLIKEKHVRVNGIVFTKPAKNVVPGDTVKLDQPKESQVSHKEVKGTSVDLPILYEDEHCLVIDKPAGFAVHPGNGTENDATIIDILRAKYGPDLHLVHRLDKDTTGCLLVAKNIQSLELLQNQFKDRSVKKTYLAIVAGVPEEKKATIEAEIGRSLVNRVKMSLFKTATSRKAITHYEVLDHVADASLLRCEIDTGRTHQIRVHLRAISHPILGDRTYGSSESKALSEHYEVEAPLLHAWKISFENLTGKEIHVEAPLPERFKKMMEDMKLVLRF